MILKFFWGGGLYFLISSSDIKPEMERIQNNVRDNRNKQV